MSSQIQFVATTIRRKSASGASKRVVGLFRRPQVSYSALAFGLTYVAYATLYMTRKPFSVVKADVRKELDLSPKQLGMVDTSFLGAYAVCQIYLPRVITHIQSLWPSYNFTHWVLGLSFLMSGIVSALFGMSSDTTTFCILWSLNGLLHSYVFPLLVGCLSDIVPSERRGVLMGVWTTSQQAGAIVATAFSAYCVAAYGWRYAFILPGLFTIFIGLVVGVLLPIFMSGAAEEKRVGSMLIPPSNDVQNGINGCQMGSQSLHSLSNSLSTTHFTHPNAPNWDQNPPLSETPNGDVRDVTPQPTTTNNPPPPPPPTISNPPSSFPTPSSTPPIWAITDLIPSSIGYFTVKLCRYSLLFWLPFYLSTAKKFSSQKSGLLSILFDLGGIGGAIGGGLIADGGGRAKTAMFSCFLTGIILICFALTSDFSGPILIICLLFVVGVSVASSDSLIGGCLPNDVCERYTANMLKFDSNVNSLDGDEPEGIVQLRTRTNNSNYEMEMVDRIEFDTSSPDVDGVEIEPLLPQSASISHRHTSHIEPHTPQNDQRAPFSVLPVATISGLINGCGSVGAVAQSYLTAYVTSQYGWVYLFMLLGVLSIIGGVALISVVRSESRHRQWARDDAKSAGQESDGYII